MATTSSNAMTRTASAWIFAVGAVFAVLGTIFMVRPSSGHAVDDGLSALEPEQERPVEAVDGLEEDVELVAIEGTFDARAEAVRGEAQQAAMAPPAEAQPMELVAPTPALVAPEAAKSAAVEPPVEPIPAAHLRHPFIPRAIQRLDGAKKDAMAWLVEQQGPEGSWSGAPRSEAGEDQPELAHAMRVRVTAFALHALTLYSASKEGAGYQAPIQLAQAWLIAQQDPESGRIGAREGEAGTLDHALATFSLGELHVRHPSEANAKVIESALLHLESLDPVAHLAADELSKDAQARRVERWHSTLARLRALFDLKTREEQLKLSANFTHWRYLLYTAYSHEFGAHDGFATLTYSIGQFSPAKNAAWVEEQLDAFVTEDESGAFESESYHHADLGRNGVTALVGIMLGIAREGLF